MSKSIEELERELAESRETNRRLNRRVQEMESGVFKDKLVKDYFEVKNELAWRQQAWSNEFDRVLKTHAKMKEAYEAAAGVLGLPMDRYHSIIDWCFKDAMYKFMPTVHIPGTPYANVYLSQMGGVISFDIVEVIQSAFLCQSFSLAGDEAKADEIRKAYADAIERRRLPA